MLVNVFHFSFTVSNLERSLAFYRDLLGLKVVYEGVHDKPYTAVQVAFPNAHLKVAFLTLDGYPETRSGHFLELLEYVNPRGEPTNTATNRPGASHIAFQVDDLVAEYERLKAHGVRFKSEPVAITAGRNQGGYTIYFLDPDDITLEMVQPRKQE